MLVGVLTGKSGPYYKNPSISILLHRRPSLCLKNPTRETFTKRFSETYRDSFKERFGVQFNLEHALSKTAFEAINRGEEAQPLAAVLQALKTQLQRGWNNYG